LFRQAGLGTLAALALTAGLYHTVNLAVFMAVLFLGAGAVLHSTGTRDMERMGGLIKRMPWTAACFLIGAAAISALPPLNGFVSEWLTFQALLQNVRIPSPGINLAFTVGIAALALTSGLAAACFVKAFGITFLALPRDAVASRAEEVSLSMRSGMMVLAAACLLLGLGATWATPLMASVATSALGIPAPLELGTWLALGTPTDFATLSTLALAGVLGAGALAPMGGLVLLGRARRHRLYETWGCGRIVQTARMEYTATAFANPFKRVFDFFYRPTKQLDIEFHPESRFFVERIEYENPTRSIFDEWLYRPLLGALRRTAHRVRAIQSGSASLYLTYILAVLLLMLLLA
jgi:hydrogenase-4 component B